MASHHTGSPNYLRRRCVCNWGIDCWNIKKLLAQAGDVVHTRMIPIQRDGISETSIALRSVVKFHFKLGPEYDNANFYVAAHHWPPLLICRNYKGCKGNRPLRQFKNLLTRLEAGSYNCSMEEKVNNFESCMKRAGVSIARTDQRRLLFAQGPTNTLSSVRSYFEGMTGDRAFRLRARILEEENREPLAVPEAVSSASPLVSSPAQLAPSPDLTPSASTYQNYIRERQMKFNEKRSSHPKFLRAFKMLRTCYENFDAIECATDPKVFLYPCRGDPRSMHCQNYGFRFRQLATAVFCDNCGQREAKSRRAELQQQKLKFDDTDGKRTAADSHITFKSLSPGEKDARMASLANDRKIYRKTAGRLRTELKSSKAKFKLVDCASGFRSLITKSFQTLATLATEEKVEAKQHIIKELINQQEMVGGFLLCRRNFLALVRCSCLRYEIVFNKTNGIGMAMHRSKLQPRQFPKMLGRRKHSLMHARVHPFLSQF
jgi:hypothetical protein